MGLSQLGALGGPWEGFGVLWRAPPIYPFPPPPPPGFLLPPRGQSAGPAPRRGTHGRYVGGQGLSPKLGGGPCDTHTPPLPTVTLFFCPPPPPGWGVPCGAGCRRCACCSGCSPSSSLVRPGGGQLLPVGGWCYPLGGVIGCLGGGYTFGWEVIAPLGGGLWAFGGGNYTLGGSDCTPGGGVIGPWGG